MRISEVHSLPTALKQASGPPRTREMTFAAKTSPPPVAQHRRKPPAPPGPQIKRAMAQRRVHTFFLPFRLSVRRIAVSGLDFVAVSVLLWLRSPQDEWSLSIPSEPVNWELRREAVKEAFVTSWKYYRQYTWGQSLRSHLFSQNFRRSSHSVSLGLNADILLV